MSVSHDRRRFLAGLAGSAAVLPLGLTPRAQSAGPPAAPSGEAEWIRVREQFAFTEDHVPMNAANLCPSPRVVADRVAELTADTDRDCSSQNRRKFGELLETSRAAVASALGVSPDEVALVRNTSEANTIVNHGLPLGDGDHVVLWDQNHPTNNVAWDVRAARFGFSVTRVSTPRAPSGVDELVDVFERALTPRTRVLAITHASNVSGIKLPVAALCEVAHRRGVHVHVDGAQSWGVLAVDLPSLGCDTYTASAHKWFLGPREVGLLVVREAHQSTIWPTEVAPGWGSTVEPGPRGARRFESMGQRDDAALAAIATAAEFHARLGSPEVERRVTALATRLKDGLAEAGYTLATPRSPDLSAGVCIAEVDGPRGPLVSALYEEHGIAGAGTGGLRLCPHLYNTVEHVDRAVAGARALRSRRGAA